MEQDGNDTMCLLYIKGLSKNVERAVKVIDMKAVFKTNLTLRCYQTMVKTATDPNNTKGVIFRVTYTYECGRLKNIETKSSRAQTSSQECKQKQQLCLI